jgi:hypothetical protein
MGVENERPNPVQCRWIDGAGHEWLFTRVGDDLIVERPNARGSVMVRFSDLVDSGANGPLAESWVLFETPEGHLLHSSACREVGEIEFSTASDPEPGKLTSASSGNAPSARAVAGDRSDRTASRPAVELGG